LKLRRNEGAFAVGGHQQAAEAVLRPDVADDHTGDDLCGLALLKSTTPEGVMAAFARTSAEDVTAWTKEHFPSTVTSRRHAAYAEHRAAVKRATAETLTL